MATLKVGNGVKVHALNGLLPELGALKIFDGTTQVDSVTITQTNWEVSTASVQGGELRLKSTVTLNVPQNTTVTDVRIVFLPVDTFNTGDPELEIVEEIGGSTGEAFPDGGEISITAWSVTISG